MGRFHLKRVHKVILISLADILLLTIIILFLAKGFLLDKAIGKIQGKLRRKFGLELKFRSYALEGWSHLKLNGISCTDAQKDTVARLELVSMDIKLLPAFIGRVRLSDIQADDGFIDLTRVLKLKSLEKDANAEMPDTTKFGKVKKYVRYLHEIANITPDAFNVKNVRITYQDSLDKLNAFVQSLQYDHSKLNAIATLTGKERSQLWHAEGLFDKSDLKTDLKINTSDTGFYSFNFIRKLARADIGFHEFHFKLDKLDESKELIEAKGEVSGDKVFVYSERLSTDTIRIDHGGLAFDARLDPHEVTLDSNNSVVTLGTLKANLGTRMTYVSPKQVWLNLHMPSTQAQDLINSLPVGAFDQVKGMVINGKFAYNLNFFLDLDRRDTVRINSDLDGQGLQILKYGNAVMTKLNTSFTYYPYNSTRAIVVGPDNINYTPIDAISQYVKNAILTSEDPSFFWHHGFVESAFEDSFLKNLKQGEFKRGGSTISMQLVKNVFLTHKKTIDRKVEEALIVWLIENMKLVSKTRMYEVYLNIIEWGPGIYGIGEASHFYFDKAPSQLRLNEAIYLAAIIPRPRAFAWLFDDQGHLKEYVQNKSSFIERIMFRRGLVSATDDSTFTPDVSLTGPAHTQLHIVPSDTLPPSEDNDLNDLLEIPELKR